MTLMPPAAALIPPTVAFALVSFNLGELGDGLGIYLVGIGWNEGSIGIALSLMGFTALLVQTFAGDFVDKTTFDRRILLSTASVVTACSALVIMFVREGNTEHALIFVSKVIEGIASSFIGPCLAALTLACFGPGHFDAVMASNILWGHIGSVVSAVLAGALGYFLYPNIKYCFLVIGFAALVSVLFVQYLPQGDPLMGRGFHGHSIDEDAGEADKVDREIETERGGGSSGEVEHAPRAAGYWEVFADRKTSVLCVTGFFFHFANANVLLVLGELMGGDNEDGSANRSAIPLIAGAIVTAQLTMAVATVIGDKLTKRGVGRKHLFLAGLVTLPIRCALIVLWRNAGEAYLLSTQILDGIGGGFFGLLHPFLVADITFGTGRFNVVMGLTASCFGLGATLSNLLGQIAVEKLGHVSSLMGSLVLSIVPIVVFGLLMPETYGQRGQIGESLTQQSSSVTKTTGTDDGSYVEMS